MPEPLLSIVVPVYNTGKYIHQCLTSIQSQNYQNWEAILIDDHSTDKISSEICKTFTEDDDRFKYIRLPKNVGLSEVRRHGMDLVSGEIIGSVDSDDFILPNHYSSMIQLMQEQDADIVLCGLQKTFEDGSYRKKSISMPSGYVWEQPNILIETYIDEILTGSIPNKIFRKSILQKEDFPKGRKLFEDYAAIIFPMKRARKVAHTGHHTYCYRRVSSSITHKKGIQHYTDFFFHAYTRWKELEGAVTEGLLDTESANLLKLWLKRPLLENYYYAHKAKNASEALLATMDEALYSLELTPIKHGIHIHMLFISIKKKIYKRRLRNQP